MFYFEPRTTTQRIATKEITSLESFLKAAEEKELKKLTIKIQKFEELASLKGEIEVIYCIRFESGPLFQDINRSQIYIGSSKEVQKLVCEEITHLYQDIVDSYEIYATKRGFVASQKIEMAF